MQENLEEKLKVFDTETLKETDVYVNKSIDSNIDPLKPIITLEDNESILIALPGGGMLSIFNLGDMPVGITGYKSRDSTPVCSFFIERDDTA